MPKKKKTEHKSSVPVLLLAGALLLSALVLEIIRVYVISDEETRESRQEDSTNVFDKLHTKYPSYKKAKIIGMPTTGLNQDTAEVDFLLLILLLTNLRQLQTSHS